MPSDIDRFGLINPRDPEFADQYDDVERDIFNEETRVIIDEKYGKCVCFIESEALGNVICVLLNSECFHEDKGQGGPNFVLPGYDTRLDQIKRALH